MTTYRILIADDHAVVREGIRHLLQGEADLEVVGEAEDGLETVEQQAALQADILILDLEMPRLNGFEVTRQLAAGENPPKILVLSGYYSEDSLRRVLDAGARGYLLKGAGSRDLLPAVRALADGRFYFSQQLQAEVVSAYLKRPSQDREENAYNLLSGRERQVFLLIVEGHTTVKIAEMLNVSPKTVEKHRASVISKLGVSNPVDMVRFALRNGVIRAESWGRRPA